MRLEGGCACGFVRYAIETEPGDPTDYCHCRQCRSATGAPVAAWVQVPPRRFHLLAGKPTSYASSTAATRWFCPHCGSPLHMSDPGGHSVGILLGSLDHPELLVPAVHGWTSARLPWFETADGLPRYAEHPPYDR